MKRFTGLTLIIALVATQAYAGNTYRGTIRRIGGSWFLKSEPEGKARPAVFQLRSFEAPPGPTDVYSGTTVDVEGDELSCPGAFECLNVLRVTPSETKISSRPARATAGNRAK